MYSGGHHTQSHHHHHHYPNAHHRGGPPPGVPPSSPESAKATDVFEQFITASTFKSVLHHYRHICELLKLRPTNFRHFYPKLKSKIRSWKAQALWSKYDKRASHKCYNHGKAGENAKVLIIGAGPCGLRSAIEAQLLGAKVVVVEKRDRFSRNNVLHLWPFVIADLRALGAKKFYGKFCAGAIDHISIRQLQCILLKAALLLGVEVIEGVAFEELLEPPEDQSQRIGWHARFSPIDHPVNQYEFDVLIGADGKRNTLLGFKRKEFRGKLAIAITANFINKHSEQEARVQEISGVAFIFNQKFFKDLYSETGIDLENIVYYKDETHYFVMTAKKHSLIDKGVILNDYPDTQQLLHPDNVDREALLDYAREAADFSTNGLLPHMDFAVNHYGKPDIAMFDFTSMFQADNACRAVQKNGHKLLQCLVGDSLLEPFWPTGSGCPRGFLSSFDACWAIRSWASGKMTPLEVIAERESTYRLLAQTTPENLQKDIVAYTMDPVSRYQSVNLRAVLPFQVKSLFITDNEADLQIENNLQAETLTEEMPRKRKRRDSTVHPDTLLSWVQKQVEVYPEITVDDMTSSFKDGRILCAIIHRYCPNLIDFESLQADDHAENIQLAFDVLERDFTIPPVMTGLELANCDIPDRLTMLSYVSQVYDVFRGEIPQFMGSKPSYAKDNLDMEDFPELLDGLSNQDSSSLSSLQTKRENILRCRIMDEATLESTNKEDLHTTKKRKNEIGSLDKLDQGEVDRPVGKGRKPLDSSEPFSDRVKDLESKFKSGSQQKPKDMVRAIGRIEKTDWNLAAIEKKIEENVKPTSKGGEKERVPKWSKDIYNDKHYNIERRLRDNGEDEERIAKYVEIDDSLKRLEKKLREGSTLETGLRGHNKVSNLASQLSSKFSRKTDEKLVPKQSKPMVLQSSASDLCHFCNTRVYLMERLSAEGKFFHRKCFKCNYCGVLLRPGTYVYDRDGRYGGKFFCIPHLGMTTKNKLERKQDTTEMDKENRDLPPLMAYQDRSSFGGKERVRTLGMKESTMSTPLREAQEKSNMTTPSSQDNSPLGNLLSISHLSSLLDDRGTTPERAEFENSVLQQSDEEEYLSEDEWTDRNFGASANELDESDDDSDYSDLGSDEEDEMEAYEGERKLTIDQTRQLAESWKRRYSIDALEPDDSDLEIDSEGNLSEEHAADGDESHTATEEGEEGGGGHDDDEDEDAENVRKARELRRQEVNINFKAPPRVTETSESGSDTEVASDEESEESDTQIDTDSEFAEDTPALLPKEIPTIVINESLDVQMSENADTVEETPPVPSVTEPKKEYVDQIIDLKSSKDQPETHQNESTERSASMSNLPKMGEQQYVKKVPLTQPLLQRTGSSEVVSAQKKIQLRRQYLLGSSSTSPKKSVSTADLGDRFKSFMDKISKTQQKLNPAPEPSPAMQAFLKSSSKTNVASLLSSNQDDETKKSPMSSLPPIPRPLFIPDSKKKQITNTQVNETIDESSESSKSDEGKVFMFPSKEIEDNPKEHFSLSGSIKTMEPSTEKCEEKSLPKTANLPLKNYELDHKEQLEDQIKSNVFVKPTLKNGEKCIDTKNEEVITLFEENSKHLLTNGEHSLENLLESDVIEAVNCEITSADNPPLDLRTELEVCEAKHIETEAESDVERIFDELASDAINEMELLNEGDPSKDLFLNFKTDDSIVGTKNICEIDEFLQPEKPKLASTILKSNHEVSPTSPGQDISIQSMTQSEAEFSEIFTKHFSNVGRNSSPKAKLEEFEDIPEIKELDLMPSFEKSFNEHHLSASVQSPLARISSLESLEDSEPISLKKETNAECKMLTHPYAPLNFEDNSTTNKIEFMDTSDSAEENTSSPERIVSPPISYGILEEDTPTTPIMPLEGLISISTDNKVSDKNFNSIPTPIVHPNPNLEINKAKWNDLKSFSVHDEDKESTSFRVTSPRSFSEPPSIDEPIKKDERSLPTPRLALSENSTPKRYEPCIPRFKDRVTPFRSARDSLDVLRNTPSRHLFTPSKHNIIMREQSESSLTPKSPSEELKMESPIEKLDKTHFSYSSSNSSSESKSSPTIEKPISKPKDGDLVRDMVMARITRKSPDKTTRRNSRTALYPLSGSSSKSSIFDSKSSLEKSSEGPLLISSESDSISKLDCPSLPLNDKSKDYSVNLALESPSYSDKSLEPVIEKPVLFKPPSDIRVEDKFLKKSSLPATPLTHPEKFQSSPSRKAVPRSPSPPLVSPPGYSKSISAARPVSVGSIEQLKHSSKQFDAEKARPNIDKEERLKELLAEHRRKEMEVHKELKFADKDRDSCVKECLEEYRQKRMSEPFPNSEETSLLPQPSTNRRSYQEGSTMVPATAPILSSNFPSFHRPSRLEIENMQVFSTSPKKEYRPHFSSIPTAPSLDLVPQSVVSSNDHHKSPQNELSKSTSAVNVSEVSEKRVKKSKDRERRRSLIQVFAGMFKSEEKKKTPSAAEDPPLVSDPTVSKSTPNVSSTSPSLSPASSPVPKDLTPKSPSVRQRLSKLRLTRPKEKSKQKERKNRSLSSGKIDGLDSPSSESAEPVKGTATEEPLSQPTSPSRTLFSFLSSTRISEKPTGSPHGASAILAPATTFCQPPPHLSRAPLPHISHSSHRSRYGSPSTIKEENYSDEENGSITGGTPERELTSNHNQSSSLRRQKAALRAARQAKNKRLRMAQEIQRQLEEWEVQTRELEERGIYVEKALRGEMDATLKEEADLMADWFALVHEKNSLARWGRELTVKAQELELEDRHVCLEDELRQRMACLESEKTRDDINREGIILSDMLRVLEEKESLAAQFEEDKKRYVEEDRDLEEIMIRKGFQRQPLPPAFADQRP